MHTSGFASCDKQEPNWGRITIQQIRMLKHFCLSEHTKPSKTAEAKDEKGFALYSDKLLILYANVTYVNHGFYNLLSKVPMLQYNE